MAVLLGKKELIVIFSIASLFLAALSPALARNDEEVARFINEGITFHNNRNYVLSIKSFEKALDLDPANEEISNNLSIAHNNYGKYLAERTDGLGAAREFRNALFYNRNNEIARNNLDVKLDEMGYSSSDSLQRIKQARDERKKNNFFAAIAEAREANRLEETVDAYIEIGGLFHTLYLKNNRKTDYANQAVAALTKARDLDKGDVRPLIKLGDIFVAKNEINKGIDLYEEAIKTDPNNEEAKQALINGWLAAIRITPHIASNHVGLATAYQLAGNFAQAERGFMHALQIDPNNRYAREGMESLKTDRIKTQLNLLLDHAVVLQKEKKYDESLASYLRALNLEPNNPDIHYNIGTAFQAKGDNVRAKRAYSRTLELKPEHSEAQIAFDNLLLKEKEDQLSSSFDNAVRLQQGGDYLAAIAIYEELLLERPTDDTLYYNIATAYHAHGDLEKALIAYQKANSLQSDPSYEEAILSLTKEQANMFLSRGIKEQTAGNNEAAIDDYLRVVSVFPNNASAWYNLGTAYQAVANDDKALDAYREAFAIDEKGQSEAIFFAALILEDKKKLIEAIKLYDKYIEAAPQGDYVQDAKDRQNYIKSFL